MRDRGFLRGGFIVLAAVLVSACQGGGTNPPPFSTGNPPTPGQITASPSAITFSGLGSAYARTVTITTTAVSSVSVDVGSCGTGSSAIVTFSTPTGSGLSYSDVVTPQNAGTCSGTVTLAGGGSATVTFTVNNPTITISSSRR